MTHAGTVSGGEVGNQLLTADERAPFGVRLDNDAAYRAFSTAWAAGGVVLVEGSDILRADLSTDVFTDDQLAVQKQVALRRTDELVGRLLADVDPARDAVLVVSPASPRKGSVLTVAAIRAPGVAPELLRSSTSRRDGFVYVTDVAPTILQLLGLDVPAKMEGQVMEVVGGVDHGARIETLINANSDGVFRDSKVVTVNNIVIGLAAALALAAFFVVARAPRRCTRVQFFALAVLGFLFATYAAAPAALRSVGQQRRRTSGSSAVGAVVFAAICRIVGGVAIAICPSRSRSRPPSRSTSATSWPARGSSSTPCSATRPPSASASRARATSRSRNSRPRCCCSAGWPCGADRGARPCTR